MEAISSEKAAVIFEDLKEECEYLFSFKVQKSTPIIRGWLNLKWKIETDDGVYLLKQYNKDRYKLYNPDLLLQALQQQQRLHKSGVRCPRLLTYENNILHTSKSNERFIVMEYKKGKTLQAGKLNTKQMYTLGQMIGKMHKLLNDGSFMSEQTTHFILPTQEEQLLYWKSMIKEAEKLGKEETVPFIKLQQEVTKFVDIEAFHTSIQGWVHRDLWVDNLLFDNDNLSAILDFDRMGYDYLELDIARAVLSCALDGKRLNGELVSSFLNGYRMEFYFPTGGIVRAIQMLWYMESKWWIHANMDKHSVPPTRFAEEMIWIAENYQELHNILARI